MAHCHHTLSLCTQHSAEHSRISEGMHRLIQGEYDVVSRAFRPFIACNAYSSSSSSMQQPKEPGCINQRSTKTGVKTGGTLASEVHKSRGTTNYEKAKKQEKTCTTAF